MRNTGTCPACGGTGTIQPPVGVKYQCNICEGHGSVADDPEHFTKSEAGVYAAPQEFTKEQIDADPILRYFHYSHLPPKLQAVSKAFFEMAKFIVTACPRNAERTASLRKLLEAKDAAVRSNV